MKKMFGQEVAEEMMVSETEEEMLNAAGVEGEEKEPENTDGRTENERDAIEDILEDAKNAKAVSWYMTLPKKEQFKAGDVVYHTELERFGLFVRPAKKEGLVRVRLFKIGAKDEVYTRDWFLDFDDIVLVKRNEKVKQGFVETEKEYALRVSRKKMHA